MEEQTDKNEQQQIGFNMRCEQFRQSLINLVNNSNLPIAPVYYIMQNLYNEVEKVYYGALNSETIPEQVTVEGTVRQE